MRLPWLSDVYVKPYEKTLAYNLGMAHGMGSIIGFLLKLIEYQKYGIFAKELLLKIILFYKNNTNPSTYRSVFAPWISPDSDSKIESSLAWCYGDLGISLVLYKAGVLLNDIELTNLALNSLVKSGYRKDKTFDNINDACFCHGTSGICHIYNRMYQQTNLTVFKDLAIYWLEETLKMGQKAGQFAGFQFIHTENDILNFSLLNGLSGVGLSLLSIIDSTEPKWDECIMLS
jgi:lantibiotic modifying enzyme